MSFLTAEWRKLVLANYAIDPTYLQAYLPYGTEIDLWEDRCYLSLVGFMFVNTRLLGVKIPLHVNFEEVNLRFYVRPQSDPEKRGVVFIKEIVPKPALTLVANTFYREHYQTLPMRHRWSENQETWQIEYGWKVNQSWQSISVGADRQALPIDPQSETAFITEHYWGYTKIDAHKTFEYQVTHPVWEHYPVRDSVIDVDFGMTYGHIFAFLNELEPVSVMLAEGSGITVEKKRILP
ncbi:MAG: DUF2071 domain-containing protein [Saprospiraceae bacterium]|nr:DUF2071 domain-containing protein [Saprospiraceae bacterium]